MKKLYLLIVLALVALSSYIDSPESPFFHPNDKVTSYPMLPSIDDSDTIESTEVDSKGTNINLEEALPAVLELKLDKTELMDGYIVESYREYEVYRNEAGTVLKSVPTNHYEYLKYLDED